MTPARPAAPVAPYLGGKRSLAKRICAIIDADRHSTYAEPFLGMGGVLLRLEVARRTTAAAKAREVIVSNREVKPGLL